MTDPKPSRGIFDLEPSPERLREMLEEAEIERRLDRAIERIERRRQENVQAVLIICRSLGVEVDASRRDRLEELRFQSEFDEFIRELVMRRAWPE